MEHLFDAFTQAESSTSRRFGGTGLGLAISRQLVELMGGTLAATSEAGVGSTFTAVIPFPVGVAVGLSGSDGADLVGVRTLIVDDNITNQRVLRELVTGWGCTETSAGSADEAVVLLRRALDESHPFDVILLDLNMPEIDGYGLARMVQDDFRLAHTPMIMLTSSAQRGEAEKTQEAGIDAYLTKPVRSGQLRSALHRVLTGSRPLPRTSVDASTADPATASPATVVPATAAPATVGAATVLLVEDNVVNQKVFMAMLASIGYRADVAVNGFEALEALDRKNYEAVFMDCQMPEMDGYQTTEKLREREGSSRHTNVIAVTASAMVADRTRCLDAGMDDYLTKPIKAQDLADKLDHWVHGGARVPESVARD
jgi:two-component system sensor histidine kinase/response regulator